MRISAGISELQLYQVTGNRISSQKLYLWPDYGQDKVHRVSGVFRRTESNGVYRIPEPVERERIMETLSRINGGYGSTGKVHNRFAAGPGVLFDALV